MVWLRGLPGLLPIAAVSPALTATALATATVATTALATALAAAVVAALTLAVVALCGVVREAYLHMGKVRRLFILLGGPSDSAASPVLTCCLCRDNHVWRQRHSTAGSRFCHLGCSHPTPQYHRCASRRRDAICACARPWGR